MAKRRKAHSAPGNAVRLWGRHAIIAALANPDRDLKKIWGTREALSPLELPPMLPVIYSDVADLGRMVPHDAPHQGMVADFTPLGDIWLGDLLDECRDDNRPLLLLDQVTDPHNVGAIFRSAAAFDAAAIITQDRHAPPESGVVAKAASGALEMVPWVRVVNLARALDEIADAGYWRISLSGEASETLDSALGPPRIALVLGAEGEGVRHNVEQHCDALARLPIAPRMESLNVSNAAAIALYATAMKAPPSE
ncbi:MAG: RNA methyltransferase [Parasphingorhabdus sp.]|nr:RNA methyltransferase [Parasphingorhabdus sp.]